MHQENNNQLTRNQMRRITEVMKGLIKSSVGRDDIELAVGKEWSYDPNTKTINFPVEGRLGIKTLSMKKFLGVFFHEVAHAMYSGDPNIGNYPTPRKEFGLLVNCMEDVRIEGKIMKRYRGVYDNLFAVRSHLEETIYEPDTLKALPPKLNFIANITRKVFDFEPHFANDKVKEVFEELEDEIDEIIQYSQTTEELEDELKEKIWPKYSTLVDEEDEGEGEGDGNNNSNGEEENESGQNDQNGEGESEQQDEEGQDGGGQPPQSEMGQQVQNTDFSQVQNLDDIEEMIQGMKPQNEQAGNEGEETQDEKTMFDEIMDDEKKEEAEEAKIQQRDNVDGVIPQHQKFIPKYWEEDDLRASRHSRTYEELKEASKSHLDYFKHKIKSIMHDNNAKRHAGSYRSGKKINTKSLYKVPCHNDKIFKRKVKRNHKDYSVVLLIDESGSMSGSRIDSAAESAVLLSEVLHSAGIEFEVHGFNNSSRIYKTFNQPFNQRIKDQLELIIPNAVHGDSGGNNDGYAVNLAARRLKGKSGERIIIVLSDGQPAPASNSLTNEEKKGLPVKYRKYSDFDLKQEVEEASKRNILIGIGIESDCVYDYYPQAGRCNNVEELPNTVLQLLKNNIKRG